MVVILGKTLRTADLVLRRLLTARDVGVLLLVCVPQRPRQTVNLLPDPLPVGDWQRGLPDWQALQRTQDSLASSLERCTQPVLWARKRCHSLEPENVMLLFNHL